MTGRIDYQIAEGDLVVTRFCYGANFGSSEVSFPPR
jgi:hypothetical protein